MTSFTTSMNQPDAAVLPFSRTSHSKRLVGGGVSFVGCLSHLIIDHISLSRRSTVPTPNRDTSKRWGCIMRRKVWCPCRWRFGGMRTRNLTGKICPKSRGPCGRRVWLADQDDGADLLVVNRYPNVEVFPSNGCYEAWIR